MRRDANAMRPWFVAPLAVVAAACSGPRVVDSTVVIESITPLSITAATDAAVPEMLLVEQRRISVGSESTAWGCIVGVGVSDRGETFVVDQQTNEVQVFHRSGNLERRIGGRGSGPGEPGRPTSIDTAQDTLFILESRGLNLFTVV